MGIERVGTCQEEWWWDAGRECHSDKDFQVSWKCSRDVNPGCWTGLRWRRDDYCCFGLAVLVLPHDNVLARKDEGNVSEDRIGRSVRAGGKDWKGHISLGRQG